MELTYPGFWVLIGFFGIIAVAIGSSFLALNQTHTAENIFKKKLRNKFGLDAYSALKTIVENEGEVRSGSGFDEIVAILTQQKTISRLNLPLSQNDQIEEIGYNNQNVNGHFLYIIGPHGEEYDRKVKVSNIENEIERNVEDRLKRQKDSIIRRSWKLLFIGFILQAIGYFMRNFVT